MTLKRVQPEQVLEKLIKQLNTTPGKDGKDGQNGKDGITTLVKETINVPAEGKAGADGTAPEHEVRNGEVRFKNPDGTWGKWIEVQPSASGGGLAAAVNYVQIAQARFVMNRGSLIEGMNIFGVNFPGEVDVILPNGISKNIIIVINDESNDASTNNIIITTENP